MSLRSSTPRLRSKRKATLRRRLLLAWPLCHWCERRVSPASATIEHLLPLSDGGNDLPWNLALAHRECNQ